MTGWIAVQRGTDKIYDLENSPLQIRTDSVVGSNDMVRLYFVTAGGDYAGGVFLYFTSPPQYHLAYCNTVYTDFPTDLPTESDKMWTISLERTSGIRLIIECNKKEVLNVVLSDTTCSFSTWSSWSKDVEKIRFQSSDTASDYYRPGK